MDYIKYLTSNLTFSSFDSNIRSKSYSYPFCIPHVNSIKNISEIKRKLLHQKFFKYYKLSTNSKIKFSKFYWNTHKNVYNQMYPNIKI